MRQSIAFFLLFSIWTSSLYSIVPIDFPKPHLAVSDIQDSEKLLERADSFYLERKFPEAIRTYDRILQKAKVIKAPVLKKIALSHAALEQADECVRYLEQSLMSEFDTKILMDGRFDTVRKTEAFEKLEKKYTPSFSAWSLVCLYVSLIGFYIAALINFNKKIDRVARLLISSFVFVHSVYILHIFIFLTNMQLQYPHTHLMSGPFNFLFGPLLYFYFKRITQQYRFKKRDFLHLIPTVLMIIYLIPQYALPKEEKLAILFDRASGFTSENAVSFIVVVSLKIVVYIIYALLIRKLYIDGKTKSSQNTESARWQRNIYRIYFLYIIFYSLYGFLALNNLTFSIFFHLQVICMALMVLYVGYSANVQPSVFSGVYSFSNPLFFKYEKSGLTESLSKELMQNLINLFDSEKIYKENDISLEMIAQRLNTTRHNASQVINEHFKMNFHELVNKYRIKEAKSILNQDSKKNLNIIDVAYEVGYNNKVTFNKAFKKDTSLTPSEFQKASKHS